MAHILIVEDEEKLARFVELELLHEGYQVSKSGNGREALTLAEAGDYDLILLDILLPGLNGGSEAASAGTDRNSGNPSDCP